MSETSGEIPHYPSPDFDKSPEVMTETERIAAALALASRYGTIDGDHHKMWVIDQMVRVLTGSPIVKSDVMTGADQTHYTYDALGESDAYKAFVAEYETGEDDPETYEWDIGIAP